jgi:magnesium transporter
MLFANSGASPRETLTPGPHAASDAVWIDLLNPDEAERSAAGRLTGLPVPARADIAEIESSSRLASDGQILRLNTVVAYRDAAGRSTLAPLGFVLTPERLVTVRFAASPVFDAVAEHLSHHGKPSCSMEVFALLLEALVDRVADVLELVAGELDGLSRDIFSADKPGRSGRSMDRQLRGTLTAVGRAGDTIGNLRDTLLGMGRIVAYVLQIAESWTPAELKVRLLTIKQDIASLNDYDQQLTNKTSFLLDATLGYISIEQNNGVKVLTVVSVVGIPPTLIASMYGMNFKNIPELDWSWGYEYGLTLIALSIIIPLVWFKVKGWL